MRSRKPLFQLRLSTLLILTCLVGGVIAPIANKFANHQRALSWLKKNDGHVTEWDQGWFYNTPKRIFIYGAVDDIERLQEFSELESLFVSSRNGHWIASARIDDLSPLENLTELESIDILTTKKVVLPSVEKLKSLKSLSIHSPHILNLSPIKSYHELSEISLQCPVEVDRSARLEDASSYKVKQCELDDLHEYELGELQRQFPNTKIEYRTVPYKR